MDDKKWNAVTLMLSEQLGMKQQLDLSGVLFLIGMQELGFEPKSLSEKENQEIINVAVSAVLRVQGYYRESGRDTRGWPLYESVKELPKIAEEEEENWLKDLVVKYLEQFDDKK